MELSDPNLVSPLLDGLLVGDAISEHHGVRCCPALEPVTDKKYIVKIISLPASQVQVAAMLLTGACANREAAGAYFKELAESTVNEAKLLQRLSRLEGFAAYEGWQIQPKEEEVGYDVYLLGAYRSTLERMMAKESLTHLSAVNLGLDLCAALSVARQSGYLHVDVRPGNIYIGDNGNFLIGDIGFMPLKSLKYASLPERCRSVYTAPEVTDAYAALSDTMDIYAVGLCLYQVYNGGQLSEAENGILPPPQYADSEMAQIILKACAGDPAERWQDPVEMGQAIASYLQSNNVNDDPIVPPPPAPEVVEEEIPEASEAEVLAAEVEAALAQEPEYEEAVAAEEENVTYIQQDLLDENYTAEETVAADAEEAAEAAAEEASELPDAEAAEESEAEAAPDAEENTEAEVEAFQEESAAQDAGDDDDISAMLAQADSLIAHETPDPVVAPEPVEIPMPEPIVIEIPQAEEPAEEAQKEATEEQPEAEETDEDAEPEDTASEEETPSPVAVATAEPEEGEEEEEEYEEVIYRPRKKVGGLIAGLCAILLLLILCLGGYLFYENYYIQTVRDIILVGKDDKLTVTVDTDIDMSLLTIVCTDTYGNTMRAPAGTGTVTFTVEPETQYRVSVEISGFHRLMGTTSDSYTTISREEILTFTGICGNEDGSVILSFTTKGDAQTAWRVYYSTPGEQELSKEFTGNLIPITGLTPGKTYDFRLEPVANIYIIGTDTFQYTASKLVLAQNLAIHGFDDGQLMVTWDAPEGAEVKTWYVRCYNDAGDVKELTVNETKVAIPGLNVADGYTVEVTAEGMTVNQRTFISAGSITFKEIMVDDTEPGQLTVTWEFEGADPADGWLVLYTIDGGEAQVLQCTTNEAVISGLIPGTHYDITIQPRTGVTVFGGTTSYDVAGGEPFEGYGIKGTDLTFRMCWTPSNPGWNSVYLYETDFTNVFASGELASFVILDKKDSQNSEDDLMILMVIRDSAGNPIGYKIVNTVWKTMFADKQGELDIPADIMPTVSGEYTVDIYFNSAFVTTVAFRIK